MAAISDRITNQLTTDLLDRAPSILIAPLAGRQPGAIENVVRVEEARIRAEVDALNLAPKARRSVVGSR